jgi:hypothetical protein
LIYLPIDEPLDLTKIVAASRQADAAIDALEAGHYDVAITLAGAAEGMLPEGDNQTLFAVMRDNSKAHEVFDRKDWLSVLNMERDWLKHLTPNWPDTLYLELDDAAFMVARAISKIPVWSDRMVAFKEWYMSNLRLRGAPRKS